MKRNCLFVLIWVHNSYGTGSNENDKHRSPLQYIDALGATLMIYHLFVSIGKKSGTPQ